MKRSALAALVLASLIIGCGGGSHSFTSGGTTGTTGGGSGSIAGHVVVTDGVTEEAYSASTSPQTVRLLAGSTEVVLGNAIVTDNLFLGENVTFMNVGSKPIAGTRSSNAVSAVEGAVTYSVPLDSDGATTRPILVLGAQIIYPLSSVGKLKFPNGVIIMLGSGGSTSGTRTVDLTGSYSVGSFGTVSGTSKVTFTGGGVGGASASFAGAAETGFLTFGGLTSTSPVAEPVSGALSPSSDLSFTAASVLYALP